MHDDDAREAVTQMVRAVLKKRQALLNRQSRIFAIDNNNNSGFGMNSGMTVGAPPGPSSLPLG